MNADGGAPPIHLPSPRWRRFLIEAAVQAGLHLTSDHAARFEAYALELLAWNRRINITAITDPAEIAVRHFVDSLIPAAHIPENAGLLDVGSGGGFPGIPLAVFRPDLRMTLLDASRKRVNFQRTVLRRLGLGNVICIEAKLEDLLQQDGYRHAYDGIISRAFAALDRWMPEALPLVKPGGRLIAMTGVVEDATIHLLEESICGKVSGMDCIPYRLPYHPSSSGQRNIFIVFLKAE